MAIFRPDPLAYLTGRLSGDVRPVAVTEANEGGKFTPDGAVLPFPGNTIVCHVDPGSTAHSALTGLQATLKAGPHARHFTFLPPASFHMTVFQGIGGMAPRSDSWPDGVPTDTPRQVVSRILLDRLAGHDLPQEFRVASRGLFGGYSLTLEGADEHEEAKLRAARETISAATGIRAPDFNRYTFHITFAYLLDWLDDATASEVIDLAGKLHAKFSSQVPEIMFGPPEFCEFETMHHFEPLNLLGATHAVAGGSEAR